MHDDSTDPYLAQLHTLAQRLTAEVLNRPRDLARVEAPGSLAISVDVNARYTVDLQIVSGPNGWTYTVELPDGSAPVGAIWEPQIAAADATDDQLFTSVAVLVGRLRAAFTPRPKGAKS